MSNTPTIDQVLAARRFRDVIDSHEAPKAALRNMLKVLHPDVNPDPRAADAFAHLMVLYEAPEFAVRIATGVRDDHVEHMIRWTMAKGFEDRAPVADVAFAALDRLDLKFRQFFPRLAGGSGAERTVGYGSGWWFLSDFDTLDARTVVWVANRLMAAITQASAVGWVHGDVHPGTVLLNPVEHGLMLDGWWSGVQVGERLELNPTLPCVPRYLGGAGVDEGLAVGAACRMLLHVGEPGPHVRAVLARGCAEGLAAGVVFEELRRAAEVKFGARAWHPLAEPVVAMV